MTTISERIEILRRAIGEIRWMSEHPVDGRDIRDQADWAMIRIHAIAEQGSHMGPPPAVSPCKTVGELMLYLEVLDRTLPIATSLKGLNDTLWWSGYPTPRLMCVNEMGGPVMFSDNKPDCEEGRVVVL